MIARRILLAAMLTVWVSLCIACTGTTNTKPMTTSSKAVGDPPNKVNRTNYNQIEVGMTLERVQEILGPGKEAASGDGVQIGHWRSNAPGFNILFVSITFQNGKVTSKAIAGD
jgi:hypothetical protein